MSPIMPILTVGKPCLNARECTFHRMSFWNLAILAASHAASDVPHELGEYLAKPDASFRYSVTTERENTVIDLTSQNWQGNLWKHKILFRDAAVASKPGVAVLFITGNGPNPRDRDLVTMVSASVKLPAAFLFSVPNEPLYGATEDGLIAYSLDKYLETKDASWPLLFPMTKSVIRTMDAIEEWSKQSNNPIHQFIIAGASKRGWTTWFSAASGDKRVIAIAPMVIDNLNIGKQMKHQMALWGKYSEQIEDYTKRGLQAKFVSPEGRHLAEIIDPFSYRTKIKVPTLIITGSNDPYWAADACQQYWSDLKQPKWLETVPNVGHNLGGGKQAIETFGAFCQAIVGNGTMPKERWSVTKIDGRRVRVSIRAQRTKLVSLTVWAAKSSTLDFKLSKFEPLAKLESDGSHPEVLTATVELPGTENVALFGDAVYVGVRPYHLASTTTIFKK